MVSLSAYGFPNQLATDAEKNSNDYGLAVGRAIEAEWFRRDGGGSSRFYNSRDTYHKLRTYAMGEQSTRKYKDELAINGDISYLNLDWTPVPIIPKFVDIVVNGMSNRLFDIRAEAVDPVSSNKKAIYKNRIQTEMRNKDMFEQIGATLGQDMFSMDVDGLPQNDDELDLHMMIDYKDDIEIAEEKAIDAILKQNNYELLEKRFDEDATVLGISVARQSFNLHDGIKIDYVDPANFIFSPTEDPYFDECYYFGEVKNVNITELKKIKPDITQEDLKRIAQESSKWDTYQGVKGTFNSNNTNFDGNTATLLYFAYKTDKTITYKKKKTALGNDKVIQKDPDFNPENTEDRFEVLSRKIDVWYEGVLVLGTQYVLKWEVMKNMVRPKSAIQKVLAPFVVSAPKMYRGQIDSLVKRMIPFADQIQLIHLKLQQVASKMIPDGIFLDLDGLSAINLGNGNTYTPQEAINMYFQTGSVLGRSMNEQGEFNNGRIPVQELTSSGANAKISSLISMYNYNLSMIRSVTGLNEARDGSMPDPDSLVGVQKLAALNSNTATRHILKSKLFLTQRIAECISYRVSDILEYSDMKEDFVKAIGRNSVELLDEIKELNLYDFGIYIELHPDEEEKNMLEQNIQMSISAGKIDIDDAIDIRGIKNVKIASQLLKVRKRRKEKMDQKRQQENIALQAEANQQATLTAEQAKQQTMYAEAGAEAEIVKLKAELDAVRMEREFQYKAQLIQLQQGIHSQVKQSEIQSQMDKERFKEDRKDQRTAKQASQQSKLIQQRQQDLDPIDFDGQDLLGSGLEGLMGL